MPVLKTRLMPAALAVAATVVLAACSSTLPAAGQAGTERPTHRGPAVTQNAETPRPDPTAEPDHDGSVDPTAEPADPGAAAGGATPDCHTVYPQRMGSEDPANVTILPANWPAPPAGAHLCAALMTSDATGLLQYVTSQDQASVVAHYAALLPDDGTVTEGEGIGGHPILNAEFDGTSVAVQTSEGAFLVAVEVE